MLSKFPYKSRTEKLDNENTELTEFYFRRGANLYVFSYQIDGQRKHTFIDTGFVDHRDLIFPILRKQHIDLTKIDNIIITHRHTDHCGLARQLALISGARILVHAEFKSFIEGPLKPQEKIWLGKLDPSKLQNSNLEYLVPDINDAVQVENTQFPRLGDAIAIGASGKLNILGAPVSTLTHSPDQLIVYYSQDQSSEKRRTGINHNPSNTDMIFSGDLWLMTGPIIDKSLSMMPRMLKYAFYHFKERLAGRKINWDDPRDQDAAAKEALKKGFSLIRVKPGHGEEFLGCRIIPNSLLADRDLLIKLGYSMDEDPSVLSSHKNKSRTAELKEAAYQGFINELQFWLDAGANIEEISKRLTRIYREQQGGGNLVAFDRMQRRERLKEILSRLVRDLSVSEPHRQIAKLTVLNCQL